MKRCLRLPASTSKSNQYLIISNSARALAASARRAGVGVHVIDLFADEDTVENSLSNHKLDGFENERDIGMLIKLVINYVNNIPRLRIVTGSGFEDKPGLLERLRRYAPVLANDADVIRQVKDPHIFFRKLAAASLPYPQYFIGCPDTATGTLLMKSAGGLGGQHVRIYRQGMAPPLGTYLQSFLQGKNYSATFLADGRSLQLIGFNETWVRSERSDFTFAGAVSNAVLPDPLSRRLVLALRKLVKTFKLRGLCGVDFIVREDGQYVILEVNPRPPVTFILYEYRDSLFARHIAALEGNMTKMLAPEKGARSLGILYADEDMIVPRRRWPGWITDRSRAGELITKGLPVCTLHSTGKNPAIAKARLMARLRRQKSLMKKKLKLA